MTDEIVTIKKTTLEAIGDAIRAKTGEADLLDPEGEMPEKILGIQTAKITLTDGVLLIK